MTQETTNSAKRILEVLNRLNSKKANQPAAISWAATFRIASDDSKTLTTEQCIQLHIALGEFQREILDLEFQIQKQFEDPKHFLEHLEPLKVYMASINLTQSLANQPRLDSGSFVILKSLAYFLPKDAETPQNEISKIINSLSRLMNAVQKSSLDDDFKKWLLTVINEALFKLSLYQIHGAKIFRSVYALLTGELAIGSERLRAAYGKGDEGKSIVKQILVTWNEVQRFVSATAGHAKFLLGMAKIAATTADTPTDSFEGALDHLTGEVLENIENLTNPGE